MKSYEIIKNLFNGNSDELKRNIFSDLKIADKKLTYDNNFKLIDNPIYWNIMINDKIIEVVKNFFNTNNICFIPFTSLQYNSPAGYVHRDNKDRTFNRGSDWNELNAKYNIIRAGVYFSLGDYKIPFTLITNSHIKENILNKFGIYFYNKILKIIRSNLSMEKAQIPFFSIFNKYQKLRLDSGDCILFNTKLLHQGGVINYNYPKIGMFFAFGVRNEHTFNHINFMNNYKKKSNPKDKYWYNESDYPSEFKKLLKRYNLLIKN